MSDGFAASGKIRWVPQGAEMSTPPTTNDLMLWCLFSQWKFRILRGETRDDWEGGKGKGRREAPGAELDPTHQIPISKCWNYFDWAQTCSLKVGVLVAIPKVQESPQSKSLWMDMSLTIFANLNLNMCVFGSWANFAFRFGWGFCIQVRRIMGDIYFPKT